MLLLLKLLLDLVDGGIFLPMRLITAFATSRVKKTVFYARIKAPYARPQPDNVSAKAAYARVKTPYARMKMLYVRLKAFNARVKAVYAWVKATNA